MPRKPPKGGTTNYNPFMEPRCPISAALENVRCIVAMCREECQRLALGMAARPIRSVGVVGAGIMGTAIAVEHAIHGIPVTLMDNNSEALRCAGEISARELALAQRCGTQILPRPIACTMDDADLGDCDLVLELISEKRPAKQALFARIWPRLADHALLATNTSTIPIARLSGGISDPGRFCGMHFCHPVRQRPLVEVIPGPATDPKTLAALAAHANSLGKLPLVVPDGPGFVVNRLLLTYLDAALALVTEGVPIEEIDAAMVDFGMPVGPLRLLDEIGLDTALHSGFVLAEVFGERSGGSELLLRLVKAGQYGMKSGAGIYRYPERITNPSCGELLVSLRSGGAKGGCQSAPARIVERLLEPMVLEARRMLADKRVAWPGQVDLAIIFGLGFPLWRGGLLFSLFERASHLR